MLNTAEVTTTMLSESSTPQYGSEIKPYINSMVLVAALSDARESVNLADQALQVANDGKRQANYSHDLSTQCLQVLEQVRSLLDEFKKTCHQQTDTVSKLESDANQAFLQLRNLENHHESIQGEVFSLKYTLQDKSFFAYRI